MKKCQYCSVDNNINELINQYFQCFNFAIFICIKCFACQFNLYSLPVSSIQLFYNNCLKFKKPRQKIEMQKFFINIYDQIKRLLCQRRNKRVVINPYASLERTDIVLRKPQQIDLQSQQQSNQAELIQQIRTQAIQVQIKPKQSSYKYDMLSLEYDSENSQSTNQSYYYDLQQLIRYQINFNQMHKEFMKIDYTHFRQLEQQQEKRKKHFWKHVYRKYQSYDDLLNDKQISEMLSENEDFNKYGLDENTLRLTYKSDITQTIQLKYTSEFIDYPNISFQKYCQIRNLWAVARKLQNQVIKNMKLKILEKLTYRSLKTLSFGCWLNDQIINAYLQLIQNKASSTGIQYKILNSFYAQTTFAKSNQLIERALKRKKINQNNQLVIAINNGNHWFFAQIKHSKIIIYDSIRKDANYYLTSDSTQIIFQNIIRFADWYYKSCHYIQVDQDYPQQQNSYDCGMFLLCGIKDVIRQYNEWSFSQSDINFKRIQVAKQLLEQEADGFYI